MIPAAIPIFSESRRLSILLNHSQAFVRGTISGFPGAYPRILPVRDDVRGFLGLPFCQGEFSDIMLLGKCFSKNDMAKKILVLEDERPLARALELKLSHEGFDVTTVPNGEEGMRVLSDASFDLVLSDLVMPKMDGFAVLEAVRARELSVPVVILTNLSQAEDERRARSLGAVDFFVKSV